MPKGGGDGGDTSEQSIPLLGLEDFVQTAHHIAQVAAVQQVSLDDLKLAHHATKHLVRKIREKLAKKRQNEVTVEPIKGEDPDLEYQVRRRKKKLTPDQQKKLSSSMPFDGPGSVGGGGTDW